ncbi:MAG: hypothetical protein AAGF93_00085 [Cyanobacteria bacterium P01_H01_bin.105]
MPFGKPATTAPTSTATAAVSPNPAAMRSATADAGSETNRKTAAAQPVATEVVSEPAKNVSTQTTEQAPTPTTAAPAKTDLKALLEERTLELGGFFKETTRLDDGDLFQTPEEQAAFSAFAQAIGVPNYELASAKSFEYVVTSTGSRFLKGPQIQAYGDPDTAITCCIVWDYQKTVGEGKDAKEVTDQHVIPLPADANVNCSEWRLVYPQGDNPYCEVLFQIPQFKFPFPLRVDTNVWKKGQDLMNALLEVQTFRDLARFLLDGSPVARWSEGHPDELLITKATKLQRGDGSEFLVCSAIDVNQTPYRVYLNDLTLLEVKGAIPAMVRKLEGESQLTITPEDSSIEGFKCALGGNISKLLELPLKTMFYVNGVELLEGKDRVSVVLQVEDANGPIGSFWSNKKLGDLVLSMKEKGEDIQELSAFIRVNEHKKTREGTTFPDLQYWLVSSFTSPIALKHMKRSGVQFPPLLLQKAIATLPAGAVNDAVAGELTEAN